MTEHDPLADWTLERDVAPGNRCHIVRSPNSAGYGHTLTDTAADQFERAKAITAQATAPRRFTAEPGETTVTGAVAVVNGPGIDHRVAGLVCFTTAAHRDTFVAEFNAAAPPPALAEARHGRGPEWDTDRTFLLRWLNNDAINGDDLADVLARYLAVFAPARLAPAEDLPPGVVRYDADTLVARGIDIPEGWMFYGPDVYRDNDESVPWWNWRDRETEPRLGHVIYEVRRIQTPDVVQVPWQQSIGRTLPDGLKIIGADDTTIRPRVKVGSVTNATYRFVEADGMVTVLAENGPQQ